MNLPSRLLSQIAFAILLALSLRPRHGYELMQQVKQDSAGRLMVGPGALYGTLKALHQDNLIEELPFEGGPRRHYYRLTKKGWGRLQNDLRYYQQAIELSSQRHVQ